MYNSKDRKMDIYTLVGKSGTGKSYNAISLCEKRNIDGIIDDGLFIYKGIVVSGVSAKKSETKIGAVRIALFSSDEIRDVIYESIMENNPKKLLIIGTSDKMTNKIAVRLGLLKEEELDKINRIYIEDITTENERDIARKERDELGKHVVPAPSMQLKKNFAGFFMDPLKLVRGMEQGMAKERTVVRPPFSYYGSYIIEEQVIDDIVDLTAKRVGGITRVIYIGHVSRPEAYALEITIKIKKGYDVLSVSKAFQTEVRDVIEQMTKFNVNRVDINVRGIE